jgi:hypothetical protein
MFHRQTLFVLGAGASFEAGLPLDKEIAESIGKKMDIRFKRFNTPIGEGNYQIFAHLTNNLHTNTREFQKSAVYQFRTRRSRGGSGPAEGSRRRRARAQHRRSRVSVRAIKVYIGIRSMLVQNVIDRMREPDAIADEPCGVLPVRVVGVASHVTARRVRRVA